MQLWVDLKQALIPFYEIDALQPQSLLLGFYATPQFNLLSNQLLLNFKKYIYNIRSKRTVHLNELVENIKRTAKLELQLQNFFTKMTSTIWNGNPWTISLTCNQDPLFVVR